MIQTYGVNRNVPTEASVIHNFGKNRRNKTDSVSESKRQENSGERGFSLRSFGVGSPAASGTGLIMVLDEETAH